jgi:hypothetical protein
MKWQELRNLYPDQFVKFEIVESHIEEDKEYVDEVAFIQAIADSKEAMREFRRCKQGQFVYSTKNENLVIELIKHVGIRKSM